MPYTPPAGNAAHFTAAGYTAPVWDGLRFRQVSSVYSAPTGSAIAAAFVGDFAAPAGNAVDFSAPLQPTLTIEGDGAVVFDAFAAGGAGEHVNPTHEALGAVNVDVIAAGTGAHGVAGQGAVAVSAWAEGTGAHGVAGQGTVAFSAFSAAGGSAHPRYELRGEVRQSGVLINRRVRAYRRDTGGFVGEADTVAGRFAIHCGFEPREHYLVPVDLGEDAADWAPPCSNRVMSVLAMDNP